MGATFAPILSTWQAMRKPSSMTYLSMWSGPRNISTALMRSFSNRSDCQAVDEPFYAYYLSKTGLKHPMRDDILANQPNWWETALEELNGPAHDGTSFKYIKHMTQHMLPEIDLDQFLDHQHCFLIRAPRLVLASFSQKMENFTAESTGFRQQLDLYTYFKSKGQPALVIEGEDILKSPEGMLKKLCGACNISFEPAMLSWPTGTRPEDGVWAAHWYQAVEASTGFAAYTEKNPQLPPALEALAIELEPYYLEMKKHKLTL